MVIINCTNFYILSDDLHAGYNIYYTTDKNLEDKEWIQESIPNGKKVARIIKNMMPETTYYFKVKSLCKHCNALAMSDVVEYRHPIGKMKHISISNFRFVT